MSASRWHMPPVCSWITFLTPVCEMRSASTSESMSASIMPMFILSPIFSIVRVRVVVLPLPGDDMRFSRKQ